MWWSKPGRRRHRVKGRPFKPRRISFFFENEDEVLYVPTRLVNPPVNSEEITIDELEALRLIYLEDLSYDEASEQMHVSRGTVWRLVESGRRKIIKAIVHKQPFYITK